MIIIKLIFNILLLLICIAIEAICTSLAVVGIQTLFTKEDYIELFKKDGCMYAIASFMALFVFYIIKIITLI